MKKKILDIGCGLDPKGTVNIDKIKLPTVDKVIDVDKEGLKAFRDNEFDGVIMCHSLEHFENFFKIMEEIHRVTKKNGLVKIYVPYFRHAGAFEPNHKTFFTSYSFDIFEPGHHYNYYSKARFKIIKKIFYFRILNGLMNFLLKSKTFRRIYEECLSNLIPAWQIYFELKVIK